MNAEDAKFMMFMMQSHKLRCRFVTFDVVRMFWRIVATRSRRVLKLNGHSEKHGKQFFCIKQARDSRNLNDVISRSGSSLGPSLEDSKTFCDYQLEYFCGPILMHPYQEWMTSAFCREAPFIKPTVDARPCDTLSGPFLDQ